MTMSLGEMDSYSWKEYSSWAGLEFVPASTLDGMVRLNLEADRVFYGLLW
jgi:hypothetical protein